MLSYYGTWHSFSKHSIELGVIALHVDQYDSPVSLCQWSGLCIHDSVKNVARRTFI